MPTYRDIVRSQLIIDEGRSTRPYPDTNGKLTIGIGHNLTDTDLPDEVIELLFTLDSRDAEATARQLVTVFDALSDNRKAVVVEMAFQLGAEGLAEFHNTLRAINEERWDDAADGMLNSKVARTQAPTRWMRMAKVMRGG